MDGMVAIPEFVPKPDWALFLDVDGTLLDLAETPGAVVVPRDLPPSLSRVSQALGGALALVSGRAIADIDHLFQHFVCAAAGVHGLELRPNGAPLRRVAEPIPEEQCRQLSTTAIGLDGVIVEDKGGSVALHYRLAPDLRETLARRIEAVLADPAFEEFDLRPGKMLWEVRRSGIDKGRAVEALMADPPFIGRTPVFVGDDETDLDGFAGARRLGGFALPVGDALAAQGYGFAAPADVRAWLAALPMRIERVMA